MKNLQLLAGTAILAITLSQHAQADLIVDTGAPISTAGGWVLDGANFYAVQFTLAQTQEITGIEAYITDSGDVTQDQNTFTVAVYDSNSSYHNLPSSLEFSQQATFNDNSNGGGWNGLSGIDQTLNAGTYWAAFEVGASDSFAGVLPEINTTLTTAYNDGSGYKLTSSGFGVEITAVPVPASLWLFISGLLAFGRFGKRKAD